MSKAVKKFCPNYPMECTCRNGKCKYDGKTGKNKSIGQIMKEKYG